jgi:hypothetical protein
MTARDRILLMSAGAVLLKVLATIVVVIALARWAAELLDAHQNAQFWAAIALALVALCAAIFGVFSIVTGVLTSKRKLEEAQ